MIPVVGRYGTPALQGEMAEAPPRLERMQAGAGPELCICLQGALRGFGDLLVQVPSVQFREEGWGGEVNVGLIGLSGALKP